jgi:hypothetical protein
VFIVIEVKKAVLLGGCLILGGVGYAKVKNYQQQLITNNNVRILMAELKALKARSNIHEILRNEG